MSLPPGKPIFVPVPMDEQKKLASDGELLLRQVHPKWIHDGRVGSVAFRPTPKDKKLLSVSRDSLTTPPQAHDLHTKAKGFESEGVWAVSVSEVRNVSLFAYGDPLTTPVEDPAHTVVDFQSLGTSATDRASDLLASRARTRGCLHPPPSST